jgi:hypothetical protein
MQSMKILLAQPSADIDICLLGVFTNSFRVSGGCFFLSRVRWVLPITKKTSLANRQAGEKANILSLLDQAAPKNYLSIMMRAR